VSIQLAGLARVFMNFHDKSSVSIVDRNARCKKFATFYAIRIGKKNTKVYVILELRSSRLIIHFDNIVSMAISKLLVSCNVGKIRRKSDPCD